MSEKTRLLGKKFRIRWLTDMIFERRVLRNFKKGFWQLVNAICVSKGIDFDKKQQSQFTSR